MYENLTALIRNCLLKHEVTSDLIKDTFHILFSSLEIYFIVLISDLVMKEVPNVII